MRERLSIAFFAALGVAVLLCVLAIAAHAGVPESCRAYQRTLTAEAHSVIGLHAPVAVLAAQIEQESSCRADAVSPVGAQGLTQFMPATARDMAARYPHDLGPADPLDWRWAIRAQVRYMRDLVRTPWRTPCNWWAAKLSAYNGGEGNLRRDQQLCRVAPIQPTACAPCVADRWWGNVELHSNRAAWAMRENRDYPRRILFQRMPHYIAAGYGAGVDCSGVAP